MKLFKIIWDGLKQLAGLILPMFAKTRDVRAQNPVVRWSLHFALMVGGLVGAAFLNRRFEDYLLAPSSLRKIWLPLICVLIYVLCWLGWLIWKYGGIEPERSDFPDIDDAWAEALQALESAGIAPNEKPLFLVFGQPGRPGEDIFNAAQDPQFDLIVNAVPSRPDAPLHVFVAETPGPERIEQPIYVTCPGASALAMVGESLTRKNAAPGGNEGNAQVSGVLRRSSRVAQAPTIGVQKPDPVRDRILEIYRIAREQKRALTPEENAELKRLAQVDDANPAPAARPAIDQEEVERLKARLRYLCRLIVRDRRPYCAVNGLLFLIPLSATDRADAADVTARACREDFTTAIETLQVECPVFALVCGFEQLPGFCEYVKSLPPEMRPRRFGRSFPLLPDFEGKTDPTASDVKKLPKSVKETIESGMRFMSDSTFPSQVYPLLAIEKAGNGNRTEVCRVNLQLVLLLAEIRERQKRLSQLLVRGFVKLERGPAMLGGCYLAATGRDPTCEQAFVRDVLTKPLEQQEFVSWTPEVFAEEASLNRVATLGYVVIGIVFLGLALLAYSIVSR